MFNLLESFFLKYNLKIIRIKEDDLDIGMNGKH